MLGDNVTIGQAAMLCVFGMAVVFAALLVISFLINAICWVMKRRSAEPQPAAAAPTTAPAAARPDASHVDVVLVTAAIAAYLGKRSDEIVVRSIRKLENTDTLWAQAGKLDSLQ